MGRKGGRSRSAAKLEAARENGKKGGRPRGHRHHAVLETLLPYIGYSVGDDENRRPGQTKTIPLSHGSITWRYTCSCGAQKIENHNGGQIESSGWFKEV